MFTRPTGKTMLAATKSLIRCKEDLRSTLSLFTDSATSLLPKRSFKRDNP